MRYLNTQEKAVLLSIYQHNENYFTVKQLAKIFNTSQESIRFYRKVFEGEKLISKKKRKNSYPHLAC